MSAEPERVARVHRRRNTDKELPNSLKYHETLSGGTQMYQDLLEMERKLGWTMMKKWWVQRSAGAPTQLSSFLNRVSIFSIRIGTANAQDVP